MEIEEELAVWRIMTVMMWFQEKYWKDLPQIKCYQCNSFGHFATKCPKDGNKEANFAQVGYFFTEGRNYENISRSWMLLDTALTVSCWNNKNFLNNIRFCKAEDRITVLKNDGSQDFDMVGHFNIANPIIIAPPIEHPYFPRTG